MSVSHTLMHNSLTGTGSLSHTLILIQDIVLRVKSVGLQNCSHVDNDDAAANDDNDDDYDDDAGLL